MGSGLSIGSFDYSSSTINNTQTGITDITQQYSGNCDIECTNSLENVDITLINSKVGNIDITQSCNVNAQCTMDSTNDAMADITFKANNQAKAASCGSVLNIFSGGICNSDVNNRFYEQEIFNQITNQNCKIGSTNDIDRLNILAVNSEIDNGIYIGQLGTDVGSCKLSSTMEATAQISGITDNCSTSGKKAGKSCSGKQGKTAGQVFLIIGIVIVLIIVSCILFRFIFPSSSSQKNISNVPSSNINVTPQTNINRPSSIPSSIPSSRLSSIYSSIQ